MSAVDPALLSQHVMTAVYRSLIGDMYPGKGKHHPLSCVIPRRVSTSLLRSVVPVGQISGGKLSRPICARTFSNAPRLLFAQAFTSC